MNASSKRGQIVPVVAIALAAVAVVAAIAFGALRAPADPGKDAPSPSPSAPIVSPTPKPSAPPVVNPTPKPSDPVVPEPIDLDHPGGQKVAAIVTDESGRLVRATTGHPVSGMSVRWFEVKVENVDADTLRLTWVALPIADYVKVRISETDAGLGIVVLQPLPYENTDALGQDLVLVLDFDEAIDAADVEAEMRSDLDD